VSGVEHLRALRRALEQIEPALPRIERWGAVLAQQLSSGARLLAVGNGGSAAQAQHLTSELVGRYQGERPPMSAIALHAETSTLTALANDYPPEELFARQVRAHGRRGDVAIALSTSGRSPNVCAAIRTAHELGITTWALTGPAPNALALAADDAICIDATTTATVQEVHQLLVHLLCAAVDETLGVPTPAVVMSEARP
jgi:D-sedoheptulose 7-phosphate isomerase